MIRFNAETQAIETMSTGTETVFENNFLFETPFDTEYEQTPYDALEFSPLDLLPASSDGGSMVRLMGLEALNTIDSIFTAPLETPLVIDPLFSIPLMPLNTGMTSMTWGMMGAYSNPTAVVAPQNLMVNPFMSSMGMMTYATPPVSTGSTGGGISNTDLSSLWNVQYQGDDRLETYGDSNSEVNYNNIPSEYYTNNSDGSLTLSSNGNDGGSANSKYPRTELREKEEWDIMRGSHKMEAEYTNISGGRQTIMQIHFSDEALHANEPPIRLEMINGELVVETRQEAGLDGSDSTSLGRFPMPTADNPLNVTMEVIDGKVQVIVDGDVLYEEDFDWDGEGENAYFKAGTYNHSGENTSVTMSSINITHI